MPKKEGKYENDKNTRQKQEVNTVVLKAAKKALKENLDKKINPKTDTSHYRDNENSKPG